MSFKAKFYLFILQYFVYTKQVQVERNGEEEGYMAPWD